MELIGYFLFLIIGIVLGLIGGGGSILTVPLLVYVFHLEPEIATSYSLFIIGTSSLFGVIPKLLSHKININAALLFGVPSLVTVFITRKFLLPTIPEIISEVGNITLNKDKFLILLFALVMLFAAFPMLLNTPHKNKTASGNSTVNLILNGLFVGFLTGLLGAGGGFLIIPALLLVSKLPIIIAIGTSLLIISANSLLGFISTGGWYNTNWQFLVLVTALTILGTFLGNKMSHRIEGPNLKKAFGYMILIVGIFILSSELLIL